MPADGTPENAKDKHLANSAALPAAPSKVRLKSCVWHLGMHNGTACKSPAEDGMSIKVSVLLAACAVCGINIEKKAMLLILHILLAS